MSVASERMSVMVAAFSYWKDYVYSILNFFDEF